MTNECGPARVAVPRLDRLAPGTPDQEAVRGLLTTAGRVIADGEQLLARLRHLCDLLRATGPGGET